MRRLSPRRDRLRFPLLTPSRMRTRIRCHRVSDCPGSDSDFLVVIITNHLESQLLRITFNRMGKKVETSGILRLRVLGQTERLKTMIWTQKKMSKRHHHVHHGRQPKRSFVEGIYRPHETRSGCQLWEPPEGPVRVCECSQFLRCFTNHLIWLCGFMPKSRDIADSLSSQEAVQTVQRCNPIGISANLGRDDQEFKRYPIRRGSFSCIRTRG
jgi:hypothetical protein